MSDDGGTWSGPVGSTENRGVGGSIPSLPHHLQHHLAEFRRCLPLSLRSLSADGPVTLPVLNGTTWRSAEPRTAPPASPRLRAACSRRRDSVASRTVDRAGAPRMSLSPTPSSSIPPHCIEGLACLVLQVLGVLPGHHERNAGPRHVGLVAVDLSLATDVCRIEACGAQCSRA
jgi:hypothetical protein